MSIKLNFINKSNNKDDKIESIEQILLSKHNPRYTIIESLDDSFNFAQFISEGTNENNQPEIYKDLMRNEQNLADLLSLIENIYNNQFNNENEEILLVYNEKINKYVVAEGNRRIMVLKLITKKLNLPDLEELIAFKSSYDDNDSEIQDSDNDTDESNNNKKLETNYNKIKNIIYAINEKPGIEWNVHFKVIDAKADNLWSMIFDKHLTGARPGMRKWNRAKYFADLLKFFPDGINSSTNYQNVFNKINREKTEVINDYKEAQFIYMCFYFTKNPNVSIVPKQFDIDILEDIKTQNGISALETTHSLSKVRKLIIQRYLFDDKDSFKTYLDITYDENNKIKIKGDDDKITPSKILRLIYKFWNKKWITTRPIKDECKNNILSDLDLLFYNFDKDNPSSIEELEKIPEFDLSIDNLESIIKANKFHYNEPENRHFLDRFKIALRIKKAAKIDNENLNLLNKTYSNTNADNNKVLFTFKKLLQQSVYNQKENYYNAVFCSTRSFLELLIVFTSYIVDGVDNIDKKTLFEAIVNCQSISIQRTKLFKEFYKGNEKNRITFLDKLFGEDEYDIDIKKKFDNLIWNEDNWNKINETIHASHKLYILENYNEQLELFSQYIDLKNIIIQKVNWSIFDDLNKNLTISIKGIQKSNI